MRKIIIINVVVLISILLLTNLLSLVAISLNRAYQSTKSNIPVVYKSNPAFHDADYAIDYAQDYQNINYSYLSDGLKTNVFNGTWFPGCVVARVTPSSAE